MPTAERPTLIGSHRRRWADYRKDFAVELDRKGRTPYQVVVDAFKRHLVHDMPYWMHEQGRITFESLNSVAGLAMEDLYEVLALRGLLGTFYAVLDALERDMQDAGWIRYW